jgi:hypothetical protein
MNRKQFLILIGLVVVIGGLALVTNSRRKSSFQTTATGAGQKLLGDFPINDVAQLTIKSASNEVTLAKKDDTWRVKERQDYPANFGTISDFLRKAADLKVVQTEQVGASQLPRLELAPPDKGGTNSGTLVEMKDKNGKAIRSLLLGKKQMKQSESSSPFGGGGWPVGRWVQNLAEAANVAMVSDALSEAEPKPENWLDKEFFKVERLRSITLTSTNATNSWKLTKETESDSWKLADLRPDEQVDTNKLSSIGGPLASPSFNDVVKADAKPEDTGLDQPTLVKLETFDNFTYMVKVGKQSGEDNLHLAVAVSADLPKERTPGKDEKPEDKEKLDKEFKEKNEKLAEKLKSEKRFEPYAYLVSKWTVDSVLKDRSHFMVEKKEEPKKDESKSDEPKKDEAKKDEKPKGEDKPAEKKEK